MDLREFIWCFGSQAEIRFWYALKCLFVCCCCNKEKEAQRHQRLFISLNARFTVISLSPISTHTHVVWPSNKQKKNLPDDNSVISHFAYSCFRAWRLPKDLPAVTYECRWSQGYDLRLLLAILLDRSPYRMSDLSNHLLHAQSLDREWVSCAQMRWQVEWFRSFDAAIP